jgi:hypothetical protein
MAQKLNITSPVGRIVMGSLYDPSTTDAEGKPLVVKTGPNAGQPRVNYFFALAIPKVAGQTHWAQKPPTWDQEQIALGLPGNPHWGEIIWSLGHQAFPQAAASPDFAWKIVDGDSQQPGKLFKGKPGKKPCENEGWPGNWVIKFSGGFAPKIYQQEGASHVQIVEKDFCKPGHFVQVAFEVEGNGSQNQPGIYVNHRMVCFRAYGPEITFGPDVASAGFGAAPLPAGASLTPPASAIPMPAAAPAAYAPPALPGAPVGYAPPPVPAGVPQIPGVPGVPAPLVPAGSVPTPYAPAPGAPAPIPVTPNLGFVQVPPPAPVAPPARQMTAAAQGIPYESYIAQNWTDALLVQHGLMLA